MRRLGIDDKARMLDVLLGLDRRRRLDRPSRLEVRLAVERLGLDEAHAVRIRRREHDHVSRDLLAVLEQYDIAHLQLLAQRPLPRRRPRHRPRVVDHARRSADRPKGRCGRRGGRARSPPRRRLTRDRVVAGERRLRDRVDIAVQRLQHLALAQRRDRRFGRRVEKVGREVAFLLPQLAHAPTSLRR